MTQPGNYSSTASRTSTSSSNMDDWVDDQHGREQVLEYRVAKFCRDKVREMDAFLNNALRNSEQAIQAGIERTAVERLVSRTFGSVDGVSSSLVNWIQNPFTKQQILEQLIEVRKTILVAGHGNTFRTAFDKLVRLIAHYFDEDTNWNRFEPIDVEYKLKNFFSYRPGSTTEDENNAKRLAWAFTGMRIVGNDCSHGSWQLTDDQIRDLCSCIRSMTKAFRYFAGLQHEATFPEPEPELEFNPIALTMPSTTAEATVLEDVPLSVTLPVSPPASTDSDRSASVVDAPVSSPRVTPPASPPQTGWAAVAARPPTQGLPLTVRPPSSFRYFSTATIPSLNDMDFQMIQRLRRHWSQQPKARLCLESNTAAHECALSHSLREVLACNPLYKLFACDDDAHYPTSGGVIETPDCPFLHVDVGFSPKWISDKKNGKRLFCPDGSSCNKLCFRSHSFEELCLYNPWFKIKECTNAKGCRVNNVADSLNCSKFHKEIGDKRELTQESDYVGMRLSILHIERTHGPLIQKLKMLGFK